MTRWTELATLSCPGWCSKLLPASPASSRGSWLLYEWLYERFATSSQSALLPMIILICLFRTRHFMQLSQNLLSAIFVPVVLIAFTVSEVPLTNGGLYARSRILGRMWSDEVRQCRLRRPQSPQRRFYADYRRAGRPYWRHGATDRASPNTKKWYGRGIKTEIRFIWQNCLELSVVCTIKGQWRSIFLRPP